MDREAIYESSTGILPVYARDEETGKMPALLCGRDSSNSLCFPVCRESPPLQRAVIRIIGYEPSYPIFELDANRVRQEGAGL